MIDTKNKYVWCEQSEQYKPEGAVELTTSTSEMKNTPSSPMLRSEDVHKLTQYVTDNPYKVPDGIRRETESEVKARRASSNTQKPYKKTKVDNCDWVYWAIFNKSGDPVSLIRTRRGKLTDGVVVAGKDYRHVLVNEDNFNGHVEMVATRPDDPTITKYLDILYPTKIFIEKRDWPAIKEKTIELLKLDLKQSEIVNLLQVSKQYVSKLHTEMSV